MFNALSTKAACYAQASLPSAWTLALLAPSVRVCYLVCDTSLAHVAV